jgi:hypothetical protein
MVILFYSCHQEIKLIVVESLMLMRRFEICLLLEFVLDQMTKIYKPFIKAGK